jgi:hypothetical protein
MSDMMLVLDRDQEEVDYNQLSERLSILNKELESYDKSLYIFSDEDEMRDSIFSVLNSTNGSIEFEIIELSHFGSMGGESRKLNVMQTKVKSDFIQLILLLDAFEKYGRGLRIGSVIMGNEKNEYTRENELVLSIFVQGWVTN